MNRLILIALVLVGACAAYSAQSLEEIKAVLETNVVGRWEIRPKTNPSIGPILVYHVDATNTWQGFLGILPFPQDDQARKKTDFYMSTCAAPMYVLGSSSNITALTSWKRTNEICRAVMKLLHLKVPDVKDVRDRWINERILPPRMATKNEPNQASQDTSLRADPER